MKLLRRTWLSRGKQWPRSTRVITRTLRNCCNVPSMTILAAARHAQDAANRQYLTAAKTRDLTTAKTRANLGELTLTQLRYAAAARDFQEAANLVPSAEPLVRSGYLASLGNAAQNAGNYPLANTALTETLNIREKLSDLSIQMSPRASTILPRCTIIRAAMQRRSSFSSARWRSTRRRSDRSGNAHP
jgi:tetratricopeptide (TPR) repeat protein